MKSVIFIAPPAAGKGTVSSYLEKMGYVHISTGDMLRDEINKNTKLGLEIKGIMAQGNLVSDEIVYTLIKDRLSNLKDPFILDGYPRTYNQAVMLNKLFTELNIDNYKVIYLDINLEEALKRALGRLSCTSCGASYNIYYKNLMPKKEGICDNCGESLIKRSDDNEESFKVRFETFIKNNEPIKNYYEEKGKLYVIDASVDSNLITEEVKEILTND